MAKLTFNNLKNYLLSLMIVFTCIVNSNIATENLNNNPYKLEEISIKNIKKYERYYIQQLDIKLKMLDLTTKLFVTLVPTFLLLNKILNKKDHKKKENDPKKFLPKYRLYDRIFDLLNNRYMRYICIEELSTEIVKGLRTGISLSISFYTAFLIKYTFNILLKYFEDSSEKYLLRNINMIKLNINIISDFMKNNNLISNKMAIDSYNFLISLTEKLNGLLNAIIQLNKSNKSIKPFLKKYKNSISEEIEILGNNLRENINLKENQTSNNVTESKYNLDKNFEATINDILISLKLIKEIFYELH